MRPYPRGTHTRLRHCEAIFNYRLSRARRIVENAFAILAQRWRIYGRRLNVQPDNVDKLVKATCVLHNFLTEPKRDLPGIIAELNPDAMPYLTERGALLDVPNLHGYHSPVLARQIREIYKTYFNRPEGAVPWQNNMVRPHIP